MRRRPIAIREGALAASLSIVLVALDAGPVGAQSPVADDASMDQIMQAVDELRRNGQNDGAVVELLQRMIVELLQRTEELEHQVAELAAREQAPAPPMPPPPAPGRPGPGAPPPAAAEEVAAEQQPTPPPPAAPGQLQVDEAAVATALERALVQEGALLLSPGVAQVAPSVSYARRELNFVALEGQDGQQVLSTGRARQDDVAAAAGLRVGLPFDFELSLAVPYRYRKTEFVSGGRDQTIHDDGFDDVVVGVRKGLVRERGWRPDVVAAVAWDSDSSQNLGGLGLGSGFDELSAELTASKSQDPLVFVGSLFYSHAFENDDIQPGDAFGLSLGTVLGASPETSLRFFLDQSFDAKTKVDGEEVAGSDEVNALFRVGGSALLTSRLLLDVDVGIGLTDNAPDYVVGVSLPFVFDLPFW